MISVCTFGIFEFLLLKALEQPVDVLLEAVSLSIILNFYSLFFNLFRYKNTNFPMSEKMINFYMSINKIQTTLQPQQKENL